MSLLVVLLIVVTKYLEKKSKLRKTGFIFGSQFEDTSYHGRTVWQELEAADHIALVVKKQRELMPWGSARFTFLFQSRTPSHGMVLTRLSLLESLP